MEIQTIIYIILGIIYFLYTGSKSLKKHQENRPGQNPPQDKKNWEDQIRDLIEEFTDNKPASAPPLPQRPRQEEKRYQPLPQRPVTRTFLDGENIGSSENAQITEAERYLNSSDTMEQDKTSLSDKIAARKKSLLEERTIKQHPLIGDIKKNFDPRKAFIYSEIFNRKYQ